MVGENREKEGHKNNTQRTGYKMTRLLAGMVAGLLSLGAYAATPTDLSEQIAELKARDVRIETDRRTGAVRLIGARPQAPLSVPSVTEVSRADVAAMATLKQFGPMFGVKRPERELRLVREESKRRGGSRHRYRQLHKGIPVLGGELLVNLDRFRRMNSINGEISGDLDVDIKADISPLQARRLAQRAVAKWYGVRKWTLRASVPQLWIVDPKNLKPGDRDASLTWRIEVSDKRKPRSIRELLFVDANTAAVTLHINLIERAKNRETYTANGSNNLPGTLVCNESDPDCLAGDTDARNAHQFAGDTYDFYMNEHGRDSLDDAGQTLVSTVHYSDFLCPNAFWDGSQVVYCTGLAVDDVVAHELTHGITENTSALLYYYQSGAINESLSDIWGEFVDLTNNAGDDSAAVRWLIGEDLPGSVGVIRDMADPTAFGDPDKMSSEFYWTFASDNGGVHFNSGINNKAAYLMTDGDTFNGYTVNGIGIGKVADIYYEAQTNLLTSGSDYGDLYSALSQACQNLIGIDGITSADCLNVQAAIDAVEMNTDPLGFHPDAPVCIGGDPPDDIFFDNFENGTDQWDLVNVSGSSIAAWIHDFGYAASGTYMLWGRDQFTSTDGTAELNVDVPLPVGTRSYLHFKHSFAFEASIDWETFELEFWDGGFVEYSTDGGSTWSDTGPLIDGGQAYNGTIANTPLNPSAGHPAFGSESHGYVSTRVDLSSLTGQSVRFRWHTSTDGSTQGPFGWVLDDVRVYTCANEPPPPAYLNYNAATYSVGEAGTAITITVSRTGNTLEDATVDYATADLSATAGADYTATSGTLVFADGETSQTFTVPILDDGLVEGDEAVVLTLSGGSSHAELGADALLIIDDDDSNDFAWIDDALPVGATGHGNWNWVSTDPPPYSGGAAHQSTLEPGFHQHYFTNAAAPLQVLAGDVLYAYVYLDPVNPPSELMLSWYADGSWEHRAYWGADLINVGTNGTDSRRYMGPLPQTGQWVRLEVPANAVGLEGAAISGMAFSLFDGRATWDTAGISPTPLLSEISFSTATYSVSEADGSATVTVDRSGNTSDSVTVDYSTADLSATAGSDYTATSGTLVFADGQTSQTFTVPILDDGLIEGSESIALSMSSASSGVILGAVSDAVLTITDDDSNDTAWMDDALPAGATPYGNWSWIGTNPVPFSGSLAHQSTIAAGFHQHYFDYATTPMQVQAGDTVYAYVYLDPANPPREVMVSWSTGAWMHNAYWGENLINVGVDGTNSRRYVGPLPPAGQWVRLEVPASEVGLDGRAVTGMAFSLFDGGATWDTAGVNSTPPAPEVAFSAESFSVSEADAAAIITVSRTGSLSGSVTVDYATADFGATAGVDYVATSGTLAFADGEDSRTFNVSILDDSLIESNEAIALTLSGASGASLGDRSDAILTITDDDASNEAWMDDALPAGAVAYGTWNWVSTDPVPHSGSLAHQSTLAAGFHQHYFAYASDPLQVQAGDNLYIYVYLDPANPPREVMVSWSSGAWVNNAYWGENLINVGVDGTNSRRYVGPLPPTGQWVRLEVPASDVGLEGASITGMAFSLYDGRATWDSTGTSSTPAPEPDPELAFSDAAYSVVEGEAQALITVSRTGSTSGSATVDYATADLTALAGVDYTATNGTLVFADGVDSQTFSVPILDDGLIEGNETIALSLSGASGADLGALSEAVLTISDNDSNDTAWMDDAVPDGATPYGTWNWVSSNPAPYSGSQAHQSTPAAGFHQHYFTYASVPMQVQAGDVMYAYVYLDPIDSPREVMVSWHTDGGWVHNAYWGENLINVGIDGTNSRRYVGPLPPTGQWVRLEVAASALGLEGRAVNGMAFSLYDGSATWDTTGVSTTPVTPPDPEVGFGEATYSVDEAGVEAVITVNRTGGGSSGFTVDYAAADIIALAGVDYAATSGTLVFADSQDSQTFSVPILDDSIIEGNETIALSLSGATGANLGAVSEAVLTINDDDSSDVVWMDDAVPPGASALGTWNWVDTDPLPFSGSLAHQSTLAAGFHQHYFTYASETLQVQTGDTLFTYVYLDPANPPREVMVSWYAGAGWVHNAYWGENLINVGTDGTNSRRYVGPLPPTGQWVRLEVPASALGLEGATANGMAFSLYDGRATWDTTGVASN